MGGESSPRGKPLDQLDDPRFQAICSLYLTRSESGRVCNCSTDAFSAREVQVVKKLNEYLKIADAADYLGVSVNTLRKWADEGRIPVRVNEANGYRLFLEADLKRFLSQTAKPTRKKGKAK